MNWESREKSVFLHKLVFGVIWRIIVFEKKWSYENFLVFKLTFLFFVIDVRCLNTVVAFYVFNLPSIVFLLSCFFNACFFLSYVLFQIFKFFGTLVGAFTVAVLYKVCTMYIPS